MSNAPPYNPADWGAYSLQQQQAQQQPPGGYYDQTSMNFGTYDYSGGFQQPPLQEPQPSGEFYQPQQQPQAPLPPQQQQQQQPSYPASSMYDPYANHPAYAGQMFVPDSGGNGGSSSRGAGASAGNTGSGGSENFEDEPPLLEELGINFDHITQKTLVVLNPLKQADVEAIRDTDLAGPLVFCLAFGGALLLTGKLHFGYIYGIGVTGCLALYLLLNVMNATSVQLTSVMSTLGYCLLPMCLLSLMAIVFSLRSLAGILLTCLTVAWCAFSSSKIFVTALNMDHQRILVAYPCALVYGVFALLTVF